MSTPDQQTKQELPNYITKQLVLDIEEYSGIACFDKLNYKLKGLCDCNPYLYSNKGSNWRRLVQKKVDKLWKYMTESYLALVEKAWTSHSLAHYHSPPTSPDSVSSKNSFAFSSPPPNLMPCLLL